MIRTAEAYLAGVLHGDGWCTSETIGLHAKDRDFVDAFAVALELVFGCTARPRRDAGYWRVTSRNNTGRFSSVKGFIPESEAERGAWLRGLFDSEGNAQLRKKETIGADSWGRRVAIYSTDADTIRVAGDHLIALGIKTMVSQQLPSAGHLGSRPVFELAIRQSREQFLRFAWAVGSSISRKRDVLFAIPLTYQVDAAASCRRAQRMGATAKHRRTMDVTLPKVVAGVRALIASGQTPTQRACRKIPGYATIQKHVRQSELIAMAG